MHELMDELYELCETVENDLKKTNEKLRMAGGELKGADLEYVDKLTHSIKSIKTTMAMLEAEAEDEGSSERGSSYAYGGGGGGSSRRGVSNRGGSSYDGGGSYARGRGRYAKRDSMGRYSRENGGGGGTSYADGMEELLDEMREMLPGLSEEKRRKAERLMEDLRR